MFSGGFFNPAVTLGVLLSGGMSMVLAALYFVMQLLGSIFGASLTRVRLNMKSGTAATNSNFVCVTP